MDERFKISNLLNQNFSFKAIGNELGKDCTTISKEVRNHIVLKNQAAWGNLLTPAYIAGIVVDDLFAIPVLRDASIISAIFADSAINTVLTLNRRNAFGWTKHLMSAMAVHV